MERTHSNFDFLGGLDRDLSNLGRLAESYFQDDPSTSLIKLRQFGERLTKKHAALMGVEIQEIDTQADLLRKLKYERTAPDRVLDVLHHVRKLGNAAVHEGRGDHREALACLKMAVQLGVWHVRATTAQRDFTPGPFLPPLWACRQSWQAFAVVADRPSGVPRRVDPPGAISAVYGRAHQP